MKTLLQTSAITWALALSSWSLQADVTAAPGTVVGPPGWIWQTGGDAPWFEQSEVLFEGRPSLRSGAIADGQTSWIETIVEGPGVLSFVWKASSEWHFDPLRFSVNGGSGIRLSGETGWDRRLARLEPGENAVRWTFTRNDKISRGANAAWLADVSWSPLDGYTFVYPSSARLSAVAQSYAIAVKSDTGWSVKEHPDWASVFPLSGSGDGIVTVQVDAFSGIAPRRGTIVIGEARHPVVQLPLPGRALRIQKAEFSAGGGVLLRFPAEPGLRYAAEVSSDLLAWRSGLFQVGSVTVAELEVEEFAELEVEVLPAEFAGVSAGARRAEFWRIHAATPPLQFPFIPAGSFAMGDGGAENELWMSDSRPVHTAVTGGFFISPTPVTYAEWREVYEWAVENGYTFGGSGQRGADAEWNPLPPSPENDRHPVVGVSWHDAVKWCNARSEMNGLVPAYYTDSLLATIYREGREDLDASCVLWSASGYRLPTEAEWEKAARGGLQGLRWPWGGEDPDETLANYLTGNKLPGTTPVETFPTNPFGLHDMSGNVWEWVWDRFHPDHYRNVSEAPRAISRGAEHGSLRIARGGSWDSPPEQLRVSARLPSHPETRNPLQGFRVVVGAE
jgi:formylglycine-generating enzyme required for sulfatase activity